MTKTQINTIKRLMKNERACIIENYGGKEVFVSGAIAVITLGNFSEISGINTDLEVIVDKDRTKRLTNILDGLIQPCYTSELRTAISVPDILQFVRDNSDKYPIIYDFGPDLPAVNAKLLKDCTYIIGEKKTVEISFNPDRPLMNGMLIYSPDKPQTMCILMPVRKGNKI